MCPQSSPEVKTRLLGDDPLSDESVGRLLGHREEDVHVDYKENFDPTDEKQWLGITQDVVAFANTEGGYLVFGVKDGSFEIVGLSETVARILSDTNQVLQKLNRFIGPQLTRIRCRRVQSQGHNVVVIHIPESKGLTHMIVKEASIVFPSGERKILLRPGMIFVRRSATNQIINPTDFEFLINRRILYFKDQIFDKITRVIEAPPEHQVLLFDPNATSPDGKTFVISDAPNALPVKGLSFTISPKDEIQEVASWIALRGRDEKFQPREDRLWNIYSKRHQLKFDHRQRLELIRFCILAGVPSFFWMKDLRAEELQEVLLRALNDAGNVSIKAEALHIGAFLGNKFHGKMLRTLGKFLPRLNNRSKIFPKSGPRDLFSPALAVNPRLPLEDRPSSQQLEEQLTAIAIQLSNGQAEQFDRMTASAIDCHLYARDDRYARVPGKPVPA